MARSISGLGPFKSVMPKSVPTEQVNIRMQKILLQKASRDSLTQ